MTSPALPNSSTISSYGAFGKTNYQNLPPSDPSYAWDNTMLGPGIADISNMSQTAPRFEISMVLAATTGALVLNQWWAVWQLATATSPVLTRVGTGHFTVTLPVNVSDQYSQSVSTPNSIAVNMQRCLGSNLEGGSTFGFVNVSCSTNVITIYTADHTGSASDLVGVTLNFMVR
jgi:hypothetical protein